MSIRSHNQVPEILFTTNASYFGVNTIGEITEEENSSDNIQNTLKKTLIENNRQEVKITITTDQMTISYNNGNQLVLPIERLAYCGALKRPPYIIENSREFQTSDKSFLTDTNEPLNFVAVFRVLEKESILNCYAFEISNNTDAKEIVNVLKETYYNLFKSESKLSSQLSREMLKNQSIVSYHESDNLNGFENKLNMLSVNTTQQPIFTDLLNNYKMTAIQQPKTNENYLATSQENKQIISTIANDLLMSTANPKEESYQEKSTNQIASDLISSLNLADSYSETTYNELLELSVRASQFNSAISIDQIKVLMNSYLQAKLELDKYEIFNKEELMKDIYSNLELNLDQEFVEIKKENPNQVVYPQNFSIRYLKPPTPAPPGDIIIKQVEKGYVEEIPPLYIQVKEPTDKTPSPLYIRERPPNPPKLPTEPLIIYRRIPAVEKERKKIIKVIPAPPPKDPKVIDIIEEEYVYEEDPPCQNITPIDPSFEIQYIQTPTSFQVPQTYTVSPVSYVPQIFTPSPLIPVETSQSYTQAFLPVTYFQTPLSYIQAPQFQTPVSYYQPPLYTDYSTDLQKANYSFQTNNSNIFLSPYEYQPYYQFPTQYNFQYLNQYNPNYVQLL